MFHLVLNPECLSSGLYLGGSSLVITWLRILAQASEFGDKVENLGFCM